MIFRLATEADNSGPYSTSCAALFNPAYNVDDRHPEVWEDGMLKPGQHIRNEHIFGFTSLRQAKNWWYRPRDLEAWNEAPLNFRLYVYRDEDVAEVIEGKKQCCFRPKPEAKPMLLPATAISTMVEADILCLM
jgi:hypothetical protein